MKFFIITAVVLATLLAVASAQDPASSWLAYAGYTGGSARILKVSANWTVPSAPAVKSGGDSRDISCVYVVYFVLYRYIVYFSSFF